MRWLAFFLVWAIAAGCDRGNGNQSTAKPQAGPGSAIIHGIVKFVGTPPALGDFPNSICGATLRAIPQEAIVVGKTGGLSNCLVYLKDVLAGGGRDGPRVMLDQIDCRYVPHVVGVIVGEPLVIRSEDATPHNVHLQTSVNPPANFGFQQPKQQTVVQFAYPEIFKVTCDVHPWMSAWVGVFSSPYFAVTDESGQFEIKNVPAGDYTLVVWQERLGQKEQAIHVSDHGNVEQNFSYAPSAGMVGQ